MAPQKIFISNEHRMQCEDQDPHMVSDPQLYVKKRWFLTNKIKFGREQQASWLPASSAFKNIPYKRQGVLRTAFAS